MRRRATTRRLRRTMLAGVALFAVAIVVLLDATNAFDRAELSTVDTRFGIRGERPVPKDVVVVGIDDVTFDELKERWVFSRLTFARALAGIAKDRPKAIAYDVEFVENSGDRPQDIEADNALVLASRRARNVVFSATAVSKRGHDEHLRRPRGAEVRPRDGGQRAAARGARWGAAARAVQDRRPEDAVRRDRRAGHGPARRPRLVLRRRGLDRLRRAARPLPRGVVLAGGASAATRRARSRARSSSSAPPRPCCRTPTPPRGPPGRWPGPRSTRTRSRRCCGARRCTTPAGSPTS